MQILSSLSGLQFSAASAGYAPTNSGDVSAIASAYQVVSATATQLYAGTAYVTSVNGAPVSASRAGNAANALLAASAWYDGTGRFISSLPDSATVSAIASSYAESAASSKLDESATADFYSTSNPSGFITGVDLSDYAYNSSLSSKLDTSASSSFYGSDNPSGFITGVDLSNYATTSYVDSSVSSKQDTLTFGYDGSNNISSIDGSALAGGGGGGFEYGATVAYKSNNIGLGASGTGTKTDAGLYLSSTHGTGFYKVNEMTLNSSGYAETVKFNLGSGGSQVLLSASGTIRGAFHSAWNDSASASFGVSGKSAYLKLGDSIAYDTSIDAWDGTYSTVASNSATWGGGGGGGIDSATCSAIASSYAESAVSSYQPLSGMTSYAMSADVSGTIDLVSTQSANWGGSALALSAGPGVKLEKSGNVLIASTDETLLWSGVLTSNQTAALSESIANFRSVKVYGYTHNGSAFSWASEVPVQNTTIFGVGLSLWSGSNLELDVSRFALSNTTVSSLSGTWIANATMGNATANITKVYGINRTAEA